MVSRRTLKVAESIREVVAMAILRDIQDPRVADVTVTFVEVSGDMQQAKVHVSVMGSDAKQKLCLKGLQNAAGFFQRKIADRIQTRYTPRIQFELDMGIKRAGEVERILREVLPPQKRDSCIGELDVEAEADAAADVNAGVDIPEDGEDGSSDGNG